MIFFLREIKHIIKDWKDLGIALMCMYLISMIGMFIFDLETFWIANWIRTIWNFTWWFIVTTVTVGYGDIYPKTVISQMIASCDIIFGVGLMTIAVGKAADGFITRREKKLNGENSYENEKNHIVILGGGKLEKLKSIVREIRLDGINLTTTIIIVSDAYEKCPLEDEVSFVKGKISCQDSLKHSGITNAKSIIIYGYTDEETIMTTIAVNDTSRGDIAVYIRDRKNYIFIDHINEARNDESFKDISVVGRCMDMLLAQEIADHGVVEVHNQLIANGGSTYYTVEYKGVATIALAVSAIVKESCNGIFIAVRSQVSSHTEVNPNDDYNIVSGDIVYLIADKRPIINWKL